MSLILKLAYVRPTFLVIFTMQPLKDAKSLSMVGVEGMLTDLLPWINAKQHVVRKKPIDYVFPTLSIYSL